MTRITIPSCLDDRLGRSALSQAVRLYVERFEEWVGDDVKGLYFFPEYTEHGPRHISLVLAGAEALISEGSWPLLTAEDAAVLVLAALVHDSAMHLTADGLLDLLSAERTSKYPLIDLIDSKTWPKLFDDFFGEARRWDQQKLYKFLGDRDKPVEEEKNLGKTIQRPSEMSNPETWPVRYRKFLGEFVRRHHARLAHEIILFGVPGNTMGVLKPPAELDQLANLAGFVARSHNMHLRATFDYLKTKFYGLKACRNVHPIFLMSLLRIADYLEIRPDRVNPTLLHIQRLRNPISQEEVDSHLEIEEVKQHEEDDEAVFVVARPRSVRGFFKLQRLLQGLQAELDTSWAVLGEVYSRDVILQDLGLTLRRVRSNLENPERFFERERAAYFPVEAAFKTAGVDLLKLLLEPLYGDRPDIGIRELLQNSLDAVREARQYREDHANMAGETRQVSNSRADILITIDKDAEGQDWLTVSDNGIGMTADIIRDYFLTAGASFRRSDAWKRSFEHDGSAKVLRSGRFGIGALAAFLLGDRIEVTTRHIEVNPSEGVEFSASLDDALIQLNRFEKGEPGTDIRIRITPDVIELLMSDSRGDLEFYGTNFPGVAWDWYVFTWPKVDRMLFGRMLGQRYCLPGDREKELPSDWNRVSAQDFEILWSYSPAPEVSCNGIIIKEEETEGYLFLWEEGFFATPMISVIDPNGNLPLSLQREDVTTIPAPAADELLRDVICDCYAYILEYLPSDPLMAEIVAARLPHIRSIGNNIWITPRGAVLAHPVTEYWAGIRKVVAVIGKIGMYLDLEEVGADAYRTLHHDFVHEGGGDRGLRALAEKFFEATELVIRREIAKEIGLDAEGSEGWVSIFTSVYPAHAARVKTSRLATNVVAKIDREQRSDIKAVAVYDMQNASPESSRVARIIGEITKSPFIPFDESDRLDKLPEAFGRLESQLRTWRRSDLLGWRRDLLNRRRSLLLEAERFLRGRTRQ